MNDSDKRLAAGILDLAAALLTVSAGRIDRVVVDKNLLAYTRLSQGNSRDNWIKSSSFMMKDDMKNCRFSIFSKFIREMNEDFEMLKSRTFIERILSHLNSSEIERFYRLAARITREQKIGCSEWYSSSDGRECRDLYLKARRLAGLS
jgi:hypothetical protein